VAEATAEKKKDDDLPDTPSAKVLQVFAALFGLAGGLPAVAGLGGLIFTFFFGPDLYLWLVLFLGGLIGVVAAMGLQGQATTAVPTYGWREPGGPGSLVLRRTTALVAVVLAAAGPSLFLLKLIGWLSTDTTDAYYHAPVVTVSISGECSTRVGGSPQDFTDKVYCGSAGWTVGGKQVNGKIEGTVLEIVGKSGLEGVTHKDSAKAHVRGTTAYTLHRVHKPHSCARLDGDLPAWAWAGLPVGSLGFIGIGKRRWSPEAPFGPFED
jgi:hypothetical protein